MANFHTPFWNFSYQLAIPSLISPYNTKYGASRQNPHSLLAAGFFNLLPNPVTLTFVTIPPSLYNSIPVGTPLIAKLVKYLCNCIATFATTGAVRSIVLVSPLKNVYGISCP
jgi:hypothetical protein